MLNKEEAKRVFDEALSGYVDQPVTDWDRVCGELIASIEEQWGRPSYDVVASYDKDTGVFSIAVTVPYYGTPEVAVEKEEDAFEKWCREYTEGKT